MSKLTTRTEWQALIRHQADIQSQHMRDWFTVDQNRFQRYSIQTGGLLLDYSRQRITDETLKLLAGLTQAIDLNNKIQSLFRGDRLNISENRAVLHTALRNPNQTPILVEGQNITPLISGCLAKMHRFTQEIHSGSWRGSTGKSIKRIVNIGIGGSFLGPKMGIHALKEFAVEPQLQCDFIACVDPVELEELLTSIDPESTLFIISSKSFTTLETQTNARTMADWMIGKLGPSAIKHHFIAVTAASDKAIAFGIDPDNIFPMWDWVGGRYSIWSAIGLPLMLSIGAEHFQAFLQGAHEMDQHFLHTDLLHNMPVMLALLGIWNTNFLGAQAQVIAPYTHRLKHLITYLQQAEMESNGKSVNLSHDVMDYAASTVVFGETGCNAQHTYHQLLHQGSQLIPVDFILVRQPSKSANNKHHAILNASALSQAQALLFGKTQEELLGELLAANVPLDQAKQLALHRSVPGNRPSNILLMDQLTPKNLGALIALYEHKIFVQGAIWGINSFDQFGVELGKQLLPAILHHMENPNNKIGMESSLSGLLDYLNKSNI